MQVRDGEPPCARQLSAHEERAEPRGSRPLGADGLSSPLCQNAARTCRHFGISRQTFYRWQRRYDPQNLATLEGRSHRPHRRRQPTWSVSLADRVLVLRRQLPRWGKDKLAVLLRQQQMLVSTSMVGRILTSMKLNEAVL